MAISRLTADLFRPEARGLPKYNSGASIGLVRARYGLQQVTKLGSNENRFPPNPNVIAAIKAMAEHPSVYPDPDCSELCDYVAQSAGVASDRVIFGNGSEALIEAFCHAALSPGDRVVTVTPSFGLHEIFPLAMGATVVKVPMTAMFDFDVPRLRDAVRLPTKLLIFSNPSNPVGCIMNDVEFAGLVAACAPDTLIVLDEAYIEYVDTPALTNSLKILSAQRRPWIILRTLSKAYGLAGLRVGYGIASDSEMVSLLKRVRAPFSVNSAAQAAAAVALRDREYLETIVVQTRRRRTALVEHLTYLADQVTVSVKVIPSHANFVFIETGVCSTAVSDRLMAQGIIAKPWVEEGFDTGLRITIGTEDDNARFIDAFRQAMTNPARSHAASSAPK